MRKWQIAAAVMMLPFGVSMVMAQEAPPKPAVPSNPSKPEKKEKSGAEIYNYYKETSVDIVTSIELKNGNTIKAWQGSGYFLNKNDYKEIISLKSDEAMVATAAHVVKEKKDELSMGLFNNVKIQSYKYEVILKSKGKKYSAKLIGWNLHNDSAVLKVEGINPAEYKPAKLGDSDKLQIGEKIYAIGSPHGVSNTITEGIISQLHQWIDHIYIEDWIQFSAAINPGNSGGMVVNIYGEVVGLISAKARGSEGMGYAVPLNLIDIRLLLKGEEIKKRFFGAEALIDNFPNMGDAVEPKVQDLMNFYKATDIDDPTTLTTIYQYTQANGHAVVIQIKSGSPASRAGIKKGDVIIMVNGKSIKNGMDIRRKLINWNLAKPIEITVARAEKKEMKAITMSVVLEEKEKKDKDDD